MLRTPDEEDLPLRHRPLPSVDIALLPHELRAARLQRLALGGGAISAIAVVLALAYGPALLRRGAAEPHPGRSAGDPAPTPESGTHPATRGRPLALNETSASALAQTVPALHAATALGRNDPLRFSPRSENKFGRARSWRDAVVLGGASGAEADEIIESLQNVVDFRRGKPEDKLVFERDSDGQLQNFEYRASLTEVYRATRNEAGAMRGRKVQIPVESRHVATGTYIAGSLGHSLGVLGLGSSLTGAVVEAFDTKVAFTRDTRAGDSVKLIVDEEYVDGTFLRYSSLHALEYAGERPGRLQAFWFEPEAGVGEFYDPSGRAVHGGWLRTPLRYDHVSSPFNLRRLHPILKRIMPHLGIDYSAPTGTPVFAAADGLISFAGRRGANGNLVSIRHANGFESHYAHLYRISAGLRSGKQVGQHDSIGFVGSTGRSTGPHLHFALKRSGKFVDPVAHLNGPGEMLPAALLPRFRADVQRLREELEQIALAPAPSTDNLPKAEEPADDEDLDL